MEKCEATSFMIMSIVISFFLSLIDISHYLLCESHAL